MEVRLVGFYQLIFFIIIFIFDSLCFGFFSLYFFPLFGKVKSVHDIHIQNLFGQVCTPPLHSYLATRKKKKKTQL